MSDEKESPTKTRGTFRIIRGYELQGNAAVAADPTNEPTQAGDKVSLRYLLSAFNKFKASDLYLKLGRPPLYRIDGKVIPAKTEPLTEATIDRLVGEILTPKLVQDLKDNRQVDLSFSLAGISRFRANVFYQKGTLSAVVRTIPISIPNLDDLAVPAIIKELATRPRGLLLITGATGSGKSTTLAGIVRYLNEHKSLHILTLEDPIEFVHYDIRSTVTQREIGTDTHSFADGLYAGFRQDPDVIVVGELRDAKTIQLALSAAETGHLVISTLHTNDARSTLDRIMDVFSTDMRNLVKVQLATSLVGVVTQQLVHKKDGSGRIPACEVLVRSPMVESLILKEELEKLSASMANSNQYYSMQTLNQDLHRLITQNIIDQEEALKVSNNPDDLRLLLSGIKREEGFDSDISSLSSFTNK